MATDLAAERGNVYLDSCLAPLAPFLARGDVTDLFVNRPGEVWIEAIGGKIERHEAPGLSEALLLRLARQIAAISSQGINREYPLLAASLPGGERVQVVIPPATRGGVAMAIRKQAVSAMRLDDYGRNGAMDDVRVQALAAPPPVPEVAPDLMGNPVELLRAAVIGRRNILISGGTSSGKTTFLNALMAEIPAHERLILIEDTPELHLVHDNAVGLVAARSALGEASVTGEDLLIAALRMRPDRIIMGEIRGGEAGTFLRAVNTGHPGSLSTIHADSPTRAIDQLALLVLQSGLQMGWDNIVAYVQRSIDIVVQLGRGPKGRRIERILTLNNSV